MTSVGASLRSILDNSLINLAISYAAPVRAVCERW